MTELAARGLEGWGLVGLAMGVWLAAGGAARLDPLARTGSLGFRLQLIPAGVLLWPWLLIRLARREAVPPAEVTAHRRRIGRPA